MGAGLLFLWYEPRFAKLWWIVSGLLLINIAALFQIKRQVEGVLDPQLAGHAEVLRVITRQIRMCFTFSVVFAILALGPNNAFKPNLFRSTNSVAEKTCRAVCSATQVGLT
jgi:hypothetical protein